MKGSAKNHKVLIWLSVYVTAAAVSYLVLDWNRSADAPIPLCQTNISGKPELRVGSCQITAGTLMEIAKSEDKTISDEIASVEMVNTGRFVITVKESSSGQVEETLDTRGQQLTMHVKFANGEQADVLMSVNKELVALKRALGNRYTIGQPPEPTWVDWGKENFGIVMLGVVFILMFVVMPILRSLGLLPSKMSQAIGMRKSKAKRMDPKDANRPDVLDPALLRPGRFDRQIGPLPLLRHRHALFIGEMCRQPTARQK